VLDIASGGEQGDLLLVGYLDEMVDSSRCRWTAQLGATPAGSLKRSTRCPFQRRGSLLGAASLSHASRAAWVLVTPRGHTIDKHPIAESPASYTR
jgi:hypothetical protein